MQVARSESLQQCMAASIAGAEMHLAYAPCCCRWCHTAGSHLSHVGRGLSAEVEEQGDEGVWQAPLQVLLDVGSLASASGAHQQAVLVAAHQLVYEEGVTHSVHSRNDDVGILSVSRDGGRVQQVAPGDPLELGLIKGEAVDGFAFRENLSDFHRCCL